MTTIDNTPNPVTPNKTTEITEKRGFDIVEPDVLPAITNEGCSDDFESSQPYYQGASDADDCSYQQPDIDMPEDLYVPIDVPKPKWYQRLSSKARSFGSRALNTAGRVASGAGRVLMRMPIFLIIADPGGMVSGQYGSSMPLEA